MKSGCIGCMYEWMNEWMSDLLIDWLAMRPCWLQTCIRFVLMCYSFWTCSTLEGPFCSPSVAPASHPASRTVQLVKQSTIASRFLYLSFPPPQLARVFLILRHPSRIYLFLFPFCFLKFCILTRALFTSLSLFLHSFPLFFLFLFLPFSTSTHTLTCNIKDSSLIL